MKIKIFKFDYGFEVQPDPCIGSPYVGRGHTVNDAIANYIRIYQHQLGLEITVDESAWPTELRRRERELRKR